VVRDISNIGKLLITANDDEMHLIFYVKDRDGITAASWCKDVLDKYEATHEEHDEHTHVATIANNPEKDVYVFKLKDVIVSEQYAMLKERGLLPKEDGDDDEVLFGDDAFD
jgi:hypothetical protein